MHLFAVAESVISKLMRIIGIQNGTAYLIKYAAEPGRYDEYLPIAQILIDSFTISPVDAASMPSQTLTPSSIQTGNNTSGNITEPEQQELRMRLLLLL